MAIVNAHKKLQIASSFQWVLSRLHRTKYVRDKSLFIAQALPPAPKTSCQAVCKEHFSPFSVLKYSPEPPFDAESKLSFYLIVAQPTKELQPDFTSILSFPKLQKLIAPNFRLNKDNMPDESPHANALAPRCFVLFTRCQNLNLDRKFRLLPILLSNDVYDRTKVATTAKPSIRWQ